MTDEVIYDPATNPRYLPPEEQEPQPIEVSEREWADLHTDLATINDIELTLGTPGWPHLAERIRLQIDTAERVMRSSDSPQEIHRAQGALRACQWLLGLPEQMARERQRVETTISRSKMVEA